MQSSLVTTSLESSDLILYNIKHWQDKHIGEFSLLDFLEEKSLVNGLIMANGYLNLI